MAEKKSWRDYLDSVQAGESSENQKTSTWRDYVSEKTGTVDTSKSGWRGQLDYAITNVAGNQITTQVNNWLTNHNNYIKGYQDRYSGRKYTYEDAYVSDSADWLDTITKQKSEYDTEADNILSYLDQYSDYLDSKWVDDVKKTITEARNTQSAILDNVTKDHEYWAKFTPNDQQLAAGYTADKVYQEWQAGQKQYADDMVYDVNAGMLELEALKKEKEAYLADQEEKRKQAESNKSFWDQLGEWLGTTPDTTLPLGGVSAVDGVNRTTKYDKQIAELEDRIERAKYVQGYEGYMANASASDYAPNSQYVSTRTDVAMEDALWGFGTSTQYDKSKLFGDYLYDYINRNQDALDVATVNDTASDATFLGLDKSFLQTMSDKEIGVYNYLYNTQGKDAANEYLSYIGGDLRARKAAQEQEYWAKYAKENPVASSVFSTLISPLKGFSYLGQAADMLDDGKMEENAGYNRFSNIPSTIRSTVTTTIENSGKWGKVGSFAYNTGMSMADFLFSTAVSGGNQGLSLAIMGTGAAADATIAAKQRGLDDAEAFTLGTIAGVAEVAMEKISLGAWLEGDMTEGALRYVLKNALSEGAEEAGTSIVNLLADVIIAGDKSEWNMAMQAYIDEGKSPQEAFGLVAAEQAAQIGLDALGGALSGAAIGGGTYASTSAVAGVQYKDFKNNAESVKGVVTESLELNPTNQYAQKMQGKLDNGKSLTGMQIRNLLAANQEQITSNDMKKIQKTAETILTKYGETGDVSKIAELATKWATGQDLTLAEKRTLTKSDYGSRVANEMLPENIKSGGFNSGWAEGIGTQIVNAKAYNKKTIEAVRSVLDAMAKAENPSTYKSLEERVGTESSYSVSESGKATISGEAVSLDNVEVKSINAKDMTVTVDGKEVKASEIDFADESQSYLFDAVSKIENITPAAATAIIRDYNPNSGLTVGEYLNGIDEGYTYGYYGYSEADLNAGNFAPKLSKEQMMSAYKLGQSAKKISDANKTDTIKRMRTAVEAEAQKAVADGKEAPKAKKMTITYNDKGKIVDFDKAGLKKLSTRQKAAPAFAQVMHEMGLGTNFELYSSYVNADGKRVILNENGVEVAAPAGIYRKSDGTVCIDLNAYNGKELTLDSMSHELTHFIQQWSDTKYQVLADFLIKTYEKTDLSMHERVVREQNRLEKLRNKEVSYDEAFDEVVANAMSKMLADGKVMERLAELRAKDASLAEKLWAGIKKLLNKFFRVYENSPALFNDAADLMELKAEFEQMQKMWAEAFVEASDNFQAYRIAVETEAVNSLGANAKVETNEAGELLLASNKSGNVQVYSEQTYLNGGREKLEMALRQNGHTAEEIKETLSYVDDALDYIKILAAGYAKEMGYTNLSNHLLAEIVTNVKTGKQVMSAIVNNGDYPVNIDLSLICKKRVAYMNLMSRLIRDGVFDKVNYDGAAIAEVNEILRENGFETACLGCFVESRRLQFQTWAETIVSEWNAEVEKRNPNAKDFGFANGKMEELTDADIDALTRELESVKKNDQGNVNLGQGNSVTRMGRLLDALPSLQKKLTVEDLLTPEGLTALRKHDGSLFSIVKSRYGAASPKIVQDFNPYASEIAMLTFAQVKGITNNAVKGAQAYVTEVKNEYGKLTKTKGESKDNFKKRKDAHEQRIQDEAMRRYLYDIGGARIQSFSDFMIENIFDYIQIFADLSAKRLPLHGYSKEIVCLRLFGMTGAKWNGSLIAHVERSMGKEFAGLLPAGTKDGIPVTVDGKEYVIGFDDYARNAATGGKSFIQSIGMKDIIALQLDPRYSPYVGNITIGVSDAQILAMLDSPLFRMVIPYHASGMLPMFAKLVGVDMYNDYTDYQNTSVRQYYDLNGKAVSELKNSKGETVKADTSYAFNAEIQKTKDARAAANNYLKWCAQRHPVYDGSTLVGYATFNPKFSSSPFGTDFTRHENYYKLLEDFNTYDCITENSAVQGSVTMNFPSEANRLTEQQMAEYQNALRETGIFTERNIEKYAKKANMTFKEIIAAEVGNRANYAATQAPKWESTVKAVEEKLQRDYARDQYSSQETDLDTDAEADYDGVNNQYANVTKGTEQEDQSNDTREESREDFDRRTSEEVLRKGQKGRLAYAYRPYLGTPSQNAQAAREGLKKIGIPVFIYEKLETNKRGITTDHKALGSAAIPGVGVFIPFDTTVDSMEIVGHEGFHFLGASKTRASYLLKLVDNIDFASAEFIAYQTKYVQEKYFEEEVGTEDEGFDLLTEEIFAYITGDIHNGDPDGEVHKFIRDYDAVKSAWDDLIKKQTASGAGQTMYSSQETDADNAPTFYSQMAKVVEGMKQEKFGASSVISMLRGRGVKAEEIRWSGIQAFLDGKKSVTKAELLDFINSSMLQIEEETRGGDAVSEFATEWMRLMDYELPSVGEMVIDDQFVDEAEAYLTTSVEDGDIDQDDMDYLMDLVKKAKDGGKPAKWDEYKLEGGTNYRELLFKMPGSSYSNDPMKVHWGDDARGVLAHARLQDFNTFIGKMLFIEEIQSDWHNAGQRDGYTDGTDYEQVTAQREQLKDDIEIARSAVSDAYVEQKRLEGEFTALLQNFDMAANDPERWQQLCRAAMEKEDKAKRDYWKAQDELKELEKQLEKQSQGKVPNAPFKDNYHEFVLKRLIRMAAEEGYDSIGWTTADIQSKRWSDEFAEGYRIEYDQEIPKFLKKYGNQWDSTVGKTTLDNGTDVWSMAITDSMQKSVMTEGQALYSTHETDLDSNRALLANAFEGITQNSNEYKLIQEYKGRIKLLNEYEAKLSDLNAEIRKILFESTGARDTARLAQLQAEAKQVAENINRNDKKLLSLEASEPLRKVIERERKKASQDTKAHVKEIIQNKKVRAEQTEMRHKIRKAIRDLDKLLNRGNKKLNVKEDMQEVVSTALKAADILFTDNYGTYDMLRNGIGTDLSDAEEALVNTCTKMLKDLDNMTVDGYDSFQARQEAEDKLRTKMSKLNDVFARERKRLNTTTVSSILGELSNAYAKLKDSDQSYVQGAYSEPVHNFLKHLQEEVGGTIVQDMTMNQLESVYAAYKMVLSAVRNANKLFVKGRSESIEQIATQIVMDFGSRKIPEKELAIAVQKITNKIGWDYEKLYYALDRIGSEAFTELIMNIANSENIVMQDVIEAAEFRDRIVEKYGFNNWDVNKKIDREFLDHTGKKFTMTLGELMSLYAYSRREGAWDHIEYGGFVFGEKALTDPKPADSYKLSKAQCEAITNLLTKEQKGYVEEMQKFLSETMGEKGNEVSLQLYGIKMFKEKNYFPIHVAGQYHAIANESQAQAAEGFSAMSNAGFTHAQNPNAKAPFVLESFNEIWSDHVNEMSRYHGTVPALEDLRRVMNRSFYSESTAESTSVKVVMENHFGEEAVNYFNNLYKEANSGAIRDKLENKHKKLLSLFRKNSVAYSLSVLIQQPASLVRAYALIDKKYFGFKGFGTITSGVAKAVSDKWTKAHTNAYNEMLQYAPGVTMAKEIGGFDTATGGSIRSYLLDTNKKFSQQWKTGTVAEKGKAVLDKVDNNAIANLPNVADKIAWIEIWNACKRETVAKHKDLAPTSAEFLQIVGERFTEVIRATQVYDSIFAKSPMLKSKNLYVQMLVSFMNEPNTVANMVEKAARDATKGDWKQGLRTGAVVIHSIIFTNVLKSIIYAMRDDDEDETYIEKYIDAIVGGVMNDIDAANYIPLLRDVASLAKGYDVERSDMSIFADLFDAIEKVYKYGNTDTEDMTEEQLIELDKKQTEASWKLAESVAAFLGIPVKNIRREVNAVIDHARIASENVGSTTAQSALDKVIDSLPDFLAPKASKTDKLYDAIVSGDKDYLARLKSTYKTDDAYQSAVRKSLRENDSRIHDAAQAWYDGNIDEYKRIFREIRDDGIFSWDEIMDAVKAEKNAIENKLEPEKATSSYTASDFIEAIVLGDPSNAQTVRNDIIATHMANDKTEAEAEKAFASSVSSSIGDAYSSGLLDKAGAERMLMEYAGKDEDEAVSKVNQWAFIEAHPEYDYFTESNVAKYHEFAEPENISLEVYAQFINGTKGLETIKDKWGDVEKSVRDQTLEVIDSLPITKKQKDALYLAAGYSESTIWDVPW